MCDSWARRWQIVSRNSSFAKGTCFLKRKKEQLWGVLDCQFSYFVIVAFELLCWCANSCFFAEKFVSFYIQRKTSVLIHLHQIAKILSNVSLINSLVAINACMCRIKFSCKIKNWKNWNPKWTGTNRHLKPGWKSRPGEMRMLWLCRSMPGKRLCSD